METMRVNVNRPKLIFAMDGTDLVSVDFYEYDAFLGDLYASGATGVTEKVFAWLKDKGLPESVPLLAVSDWMVAVDKHLEEQVKKMIGS